MSLEEAIKHVEHQSSVDPSTYASLLRRCSIERALSQGKRLHAQILHHSYEYDTFIANHLIQMYASCGILTEAKRVFDTMHKWNVFSWNIMLAAYAQNGYLQDARDLFDKMQERNTVSWNTIFTAYAQNGHVEEAQKIFNKMSQRSSISWNGIIAAYAQEGHFELALVFFWKMNLEGFKPTRVTWISVLNSCGNIPGFRTGKAYHEAVRLSGLETDGTIATALVDMYGNLGEPDLAWNVFSGISHANTVSWNAMISAFLQNGCLTKALHVFHMMSLQGAECDEVTFLSIFKVCSKSHYMFVEGKHLYDRLVECGFNMSVNLETAALTLFANHMQLDLVENVFHKMHHRDVVSWTIVMRVYVERGEFRKAFYIFMNMDLNGVPPDRVTVLTILNSVDNLSQVEVIHREIVNLLGLQSDAKVGAALVILYSKCASLSRAKASFDAVIEKNIALFTVMMVAYIQNGCSNKALDLFKAMDLEGMRLDYIAVGYAFDACVILSQAKTVHASVLDSGMEVNAALQVSLAGMYERCGSPQDSFEMSERANTLPAFSLERLVLGLLSQRVPRVEILQTLRVMDLEGLGFWLNAQDVNRVISSCRDGSLAKFIHGRVFEECVAPDPQVASALINMHGKCGNLFHAREVFDRLGYCRDFVVYTAMMAAYFHQTESRWKEIFTLFETMNLEGVVPSDVSYIILLSACSHMGMLETGLGYFRDMLQDYGICATGQHCVCILDLLARAGRLEEAERVAVDVDEVQPWLSLLSACSIHGDSERGFRSSRHVLQMPAAGGISAPYALAWNVCAPEAY